MLALSSVWTIIPAVAALIIAKDMSVRDVEALVDEAGRHRAADRPATHHQNPRSVPLSFRGHRDTLLQGRLGRAAARRA